MVLSAMGRRYRVSFRHADGAIDAVTVWADDSRLAEQVARDWIEQAAFQPVSGAEARTEEIGAEPDRGDIGVAESHAAVNHERVSATELLRARSTDLISMNCGD
jgi:hypothetical protein